MQLLIWVVTGLLAGWLARAILGNKPRLGILGDLTLGVLGGSFGGWLFKAMEITASRAAPSQALVALFGAILLIAIARFSVRTWARSAEILPSTERTKALVGDLESLVRRLGDWDRRVLVHVLKRERVARDASAEFDEQLTLGQRVADVVAGFGGSWNFIAIFVLVMVFWMLLNAETKVHFDPYPFILLNLLLSCLAALQAPIIMMSQNRQAEKDRWQARAEYELNVKAEMEIMAMSAQLDELRTRIEQLILPQPPSAGGEGDPSPGSHRRQPR
jgi:uncharacterized membrane protein/uncharacterized membrane protein YeaQ/YmgE (transglycosylase-associated protein family)